MSINYKYILNHRYIFKEQQKFSKNMVSATWVFKNMVSATKAAIYS